MSARGDTTFPLVLRALVAGCLALAGCATMPNPPQTAWYGLDPQAPLGAQEMFGARRVPQGEPDAVASPPAKALPPSGATVVTPQGPAAQRLPRLPSSANGGGKPAEALELAVQAP